MKHEKRLSIKEKITIARDANKYSLGRKLLMKKYSISEGKARNILKNMTKYQSLNININDDKKNLTQSMSDKFRIIDEIVLNYVRLLRGENVPISFNILMTIIKKVKNEHKLNHKITNYFVRKFIERNKMLYVTLHGEQRSSNFYEIESFKF
ncbi:hypothetical protein DMUE_0926 [Dictyocoela muelleri]|nr:hypothetical protein DMUE_0926 [Dictyocoela muelleri]